jgi:hypothetical protein
MSQNRFALRAPASQKYVLFALVLLASATVLGSHTSAQNPTQTGAERFYYYCEGLATDRAPGRPDRDTYYVTSVFMSDYDDSVGQLVSEAWRKHLRTLAGNNLTGAASCAKGDFSSGKPAETAALEQFKLQPEERAKNNEEYHRSARTSLSVVHLDWRPPAGLHLPGAYVPQGSRATYHFYCVATAETRVSSTAVRRTSYISGIFESDRPREALEESWRNYVRPKANYFSTLFCRPGDFSVQNLRENDIRGLRLSGELIEVNWTPDQANRVAEVSPDSPSGMPPDLHRLIEHEATSTAAEICRGGNLRGYYGQSGNSFDCSCFSQKVREYRLKQYEQDGMKMVGMSHAGPALNPDLGILLLPRSSPTLDFRSCALPGNASSLSSGAASVGGAPTGPMTGTPAPVQSGRVSAMPGAYPAAGGVQDGTASSPLRAGTAPASTRAAIVGFCWADADPKVAYYSAPFDGANGGYPEWTSAFQSFLSGKYGYTRFVRCDHKTSMDEAAKSLALEKSYSTQHGQRIVETAWKYK